jgi:hypothetical protein
MPNQRKASEKILSLDRGFELFYTLFMFLHYKSAFHTCKTIRTMAIDFEPILSYSVNKFNNGGRVLKGDRGLN